MYGVVKAVIESKKYELRDMLKKLDIFWLHGNITEDERTELIRLAQSNAQASNSVDVLAKMEELDKRVKALEDVLANIDSTEDGAIGEETEEPVTVTYPEYEIGKWYYTDDIVSFNGANYICVAPVGAVCVWNPEDYPAYWAVYEEDLELVNAEEEGEPLV